MGISNREWLYSLDPHALTEWFESEHGSNDTLGAKKVVSGYGVDANDGNAASLKVSSDINQNVTDNRETAETYNNSVADVTDSRDAENSVTAAVVDDNGANVSEHVEDANGTLDGARVALDAKIDSRAKLEADVQKWCGMYAYQVDMVIVWLNRQAAITERELCALLEENGVHVSHDGLRHITTVEVQRIYEQNVEIAELQAQVDKLTAERDYYIGLCHRAVEAGEKFATLVDMNGEVLS